MFKGQHKGVWEGDETNRIEWLTLCRADSDDLP